jgi:hypothetical protein
MINLKRRHDWPELQKEHTFDLADGVANYALPADFERFISRTHWSRADQWENSFPISPQEWQWRKSGISEVTPWKHLRVKNAVDNQIFVHPTPDSGEAGDTLVFEYISSQVIKPATWTQSTTYMPGSYTWYNGNVYFTALGGTSGSTPPTGTGSSISDGGITDWAYQSEPYLEFLKDTDEPILDDHIVELGVQWRMMYQKGFQFQQYKDEYEMEVDSEATSKSGSRILDMTGARPSFSIGPNNVPDGNFPGV